MRTCRQTQQEVIAGRAWTHEAPGEHARVEGLRAYAFIIAVLVVMALAALLTSGPKSRRSTAADPEFVEAEP